MRHIWFLLMETMLLLTVVSAVRSGDAHSLHVKDDPTPSKVFDKITNMIKREIAHQQDKLASMASEEALCKKELQTLKENLDKQTAAVKEKMKALEDAKKADKEYLDNRLKTAKSRAKEAAKERKDAEAKAREFEREHPAAALRGQQEESLRRQEEMMNKRTGNVEKKEKPQRETEKKITIAKHELKEEMGRLKNFEKQRELLHDKCLAPSKDTSEDRAEKREQEIESLEKAHEILDKPSWK